MFKYPTKYSFNGLNLDQNKMVKHISKKESDRTYICDDFMSGIYFDMRTRHPFYNSHVPNWGFSQSDIVIRFLYR